MTPDERQLINGLFDRMRGIGAVEKDRDAEALITQAVRQMPDSPYMLVQSVLVQEHALQQADQRIRELEERVQELEAQATQSRPPQSSGGGSFLGGLFGGSPRSAPPSAPMARGSVPVTGAPSYGSQPYQSGPPVGAPGPAGSPWGQQGRPGPGGGGGFLQSAMSTAAGVAGGMLLANSISSMLGGHSAAAAVPHAPTLDTTHPDHQQSQPHYQDASDNDPGSDSEPHYQNASDNDPGNDPDLQDVDLNDDDGGWGDDGGGDIDI
jgi:hypothetical protein